MNRDLEQEAELSIVREREQWAALIQIDDGTPSAWEDLVRRSVPYIRRGFFLPRWESNSAFTPSAMPNFHGFPADLEAEWQAYHGRWQAFLDLNPRARIADMLSDCSESNDSSSFPTGWEHVVQRWALAGFPEPAPFYANKRILSEAWKSQLADAMRRAGDGWVYQDDDINLRWRS